MGAGRGGPGDGVGVGRREPLGGPQPDEGERLWREVTEGLPETKGREVSILAANEAESGICYALTNLGLYC